MAGLPTVDSLATYGGAKQDYEPVEDPTTDLSAEGWNLVASNVAGLTQTACRAWVTFLGHGTMPTDPSSYIHGAVWGDTLGVKPTMARTGTGVFTATWPTTVTDDLGVVQTVNLRRAWASFEGSTLYSVNATVTAANVVTIRVWNAAGSLNDAVGAVFNVFVV